MDTEAAWPPRSAHAALLSSPSGRKKYIQYERNKENCTSPIKRSTTRPNFARHGTEAMDDDGDDEDDEETLQLKLAAIEAKLKLKKLQQNRTRTDAVSGLDERLGSSRPSSVVSSHATRLRDSEEAGKAAYTRENVNVPLSPTKRAPIDLTQRSPGRVLLGIDKGVTSAGVSLRRARTVHASPGKYSSQISSSQTRSSSRSSAFNSARSGASGRSAEQVPVKSFSERMAEVRNIDTSQQNRREAISRMRGKALNLDKAELNSYRSVAEEASQKDPPRSPSRGRLETMFTRDDILASGRQTETAPKTLKKSRTMPDLRQSPSRSNLKSEARNTDQDLSQTRSRVDPSLYEPFSRLNLSSRILPQSFLKRTLPEETFTCMRISDLLKDVIAPSYELPESVIDFAVFGIIASKSSPLDHKTTNAEDKSKGSEDWKKKWEDGSQNQRKFMVFTVTDLKWSIDLYLFGTAVPQYHRLSPGTVVAILNPSIMPPKKGREDTGAFSLTLHDKDDTVLEVGRSRDLGFCNAQKKDGNECGQWINASKTEICEFHLNLQVAKQQSSRMGVNTGTNGFGNMPKNKNNSFVPGQKGKGDMQGRNLLPRQEGHQYDRWTGSHFYIASSTVGSGSASRVAGAPIYRSEQSTARMLDNDCDDPFIAEGQMSRDKDARMRKRLVNQAKEREIAEKLVAMGTGGAGGEYLRSRVDKTTVSKESASISGSQKSALSTKHDVLNFPSAQNSNGKRLAQDVRLSPIKKTRFVTEKGIREAGRESLGAKRRNDNEDDDLDIV